MKLLVSASAPAPRQPQQSDPGQQKEQSGRLGHRRHAEDYAGALLDRISIQDADCFVVRAALAEASVRMVDTAAILTRLTGVFIGSPSRLSI
jgi:hypothetical protein